MIAAIYERSFTEPLEKLATNVLDGLAAALVGPASTLRDGTEHAGVELPRDLYAHADAQTEWWYYTGHMQTASGRGFGFELVFFKRRTDLDRFGIVPPPAAALWREVCALGAQRRKRGGRAQH